jgi:hypothetical protein
MYMPPGYLIKVSLGQTYLPLAPWLAILNPDITDSPLHGLYLVYLFSEDKQLVHLSLLQGITEVELKEGRGQRSRSVLSAQAADIRMALGDHIISDGKEVIDLRSKGIRQRAYEAATVVAKTYQLSALPTDQDLALDLSSMLDQYAIAAEVVREMARDGARPLDLRVPGPPSRRLPDQYEFRPKDGSQYRAEVRAHTEIRDRRHELLVADYGDWLKSRNLKPSTAQHPIDIVVAHNGREWLAELEVVRDANAAPAVREAIGQLLEYSFAYYFSHSKPEPVLVAVFSEPVGDFYIALLSRLGIEVTWKDHGKWFGYPAST